MGIEAYIAGLSMSMAQANVTTQVSTKMLKNVLDSDANSAAQLISTMSDIPQASYGEVGGLMDVSC